MRFGNNVSDSELLSLGNDFQSVNGLDEYHARRLVYLKRLDPNPNRYSREQCIELIHSDNRRILEQQAQIPPPAPYPSAPNAPYPGQQGQNVYEYNPSAPYPGGPGNNNPYPNQGNAYPNQGGNAYPNQGNAYPNQGGNAYPPSDPYPQGPAMSDRERERAMRQAERQRERLERQAEREREMAERQRERLERQAERERERLERQAEREREIAERQRERQNRISPFGGGDVYPGHHHGHHHGHHGHHHGHQPEKVPLPLPPAGGRKKAVLIGINYKGESNQLKGCIMDTKCKSNPPGQDPLLIFWLTRFFSDMYHLLVSKFSYNPSDIVMLNEKSGHRDFMPTRDNILSASNWLLSGTRPGDSLVFFFSGHGGQQRDRTGREADGKSETIIPLDHRQVGSILDSELYTYLVQPLPQGSRLHMICDSCHSGTILDLNYVHTPPKHVNGPRADRWEPINNLPTAGPVYGIWGDVFLISGCMDNQTSVTTSKMSHGRATTGAMLYSFVQAIETGRGRTYGELLFEMRRIIEATLDNKQTDRFSYNYGLNDQNTNYYGSSFRPENRGMSSALSARGGKESPALAAKLAVGIGASIAAGAAVAIAAGSAGVPGLGLAAGVAFKQFETRYFEGFLGGKTQIPQLSSARAINLRSPFSL